MDSKAKSEARAESERIAAAATAKQAADDATSASLEGVSDITLAASDVGRAEQAARDQAKLDAAKRAAAEARARGLKLANQPVVEGIAEPARRPDEREVTYNHARRFPQMKKTRKKRRGRGHARVARRKGKRIKIKSLNLHKGR